MTAQEIFLLLTVAGVAFSFGWRGRGIYNERKAAAAPPTAERPPFCKQFDAATPHRALARSVAGALEAMASARMRAGHCMTIDSNAPAACTLEPIELPPVVAALGFIRAIRINGEAAELPVELATGDVVSLDVVLGERKAPR